MSSEIEKYTRILYYYTLIYSTLEDAFLDYVAWNSSRDNFLATFIELVEFFPSLMGRTFWTNVFFSSTTQIVL